MKLSALFLLFTLALPTQQGEKINLMCQTWKQVGLKQFRGKYRAITNMPKIMTLRTDGSYEETYGTLRSKGRWKFSRDSSKFAVSLTEFNGQNINNMPLDKAIPTDSIIKLTHDTLIYGSLGTFGPGNKLGQGYGHNDWYFVRVK